MQYIDTRSDTVTVPTLQMRQALYNAEVGDDVYGDDPTVILLEKQSAELMGKQAACLVPSGVFGNQVSVFTHAGRPGDQIILSDQCHMIQYQNGSLAKFSRLLTKVIKTEGGLLKPKDVLAAIRKDKKDIHNPLTTILELQNPTALGRIYDLNDYDQLCKIGKQNNLLIHLDGARIFNACVQLGIQASQLTKNVDSVSFCLSKGLCAPIGSIVAGSASFIERFRRNRKLFGGGMRQVGVIAGPGLVAIRKMRHFLGKDNQMARLLANKFQKFNWVQVIGKVDINIMFFKLRVKEIDLNDLRNFLKENKILMTLPKSIQTPIRIITHHYIRENEIDIIIDKLNEYITKNTIEVQQ